MTIVLPLIILLIQPHSTRFNLVKTGRLTTKIIPALLHMDCNMKSVIFLYSGWPRLHILNAGIKFQFQILHRYGLMRYLTFCLKLLQHRLSRAIIAHLANRITTFSLTLHTPGGAPSAPASGAMFASRKVFEQVVL